MQRIPKYFILLLLGGVCVLAFPSRSESEELSPQKMEEIDQQATPDVRFRYFYKTGREWSDASYEERDSFLKEASDENKERQKRIKEIQNDKKERAAKVKQKERVINTKRKELKQKQDELRRAKKQEYRERTQHLKKLKRERTKNIKDLRARSKK